MLKSLVPKLVEIKGWSPTDLMRQTGLSWQRALQIFHGEIPGSKALDMLCEALDCQPSDVLLHIKEGK